MWTERGEFQVVGGMPAATVRPWSWMGAKMNPSRKKNGAKWVGRPAVNSCHNMPQLVSNTHTHTQTHLSALFPGLPGWAGTRKVTPIWILLKQETVSGSSISWAICKSASRSRQITTPAPHHSSFLQAGCPSCRSTNSVKALKALVNN